MMLNLQQDETINYISVTLSVLSVVYGTADSVTFEKYDHKAPFSKVVFSSLSGFIDSSFRILFISFFAAINSPYCLILIPFVYVTSFYLMISFNYKKCKLAFDEFIACFYSLPSSIYEHEDIEYSFRPKSKLVFNVLVFGCLSLTTGPVWKTHPKLDQKELPTTLNGTVYEVYDYCENICNVTDISICGTFSQPEEAYHGLLITLWVLLALSTLEGILERYLSWMPHRKFLEPIE